MSVLAPKGFEAAGGHVGIKAGAALDCAVVALAGSEAGSAAGVFTTNLAAAAPVQVSRRHLTSTQGRARAVVLTSGNANAATGSLGVERAEELCTTVATAIGADPHEVLIAQTGLIGVPFAFEGCASDVAALCAQLGATSEHASGAARAIMTTDTVRKEFATARDGFSVGAMAKGAAMLAPNMATMLAVLTTDADVTPAVLAGLLRDAVDPTFNALHVDGATSTNDTVFALSSGAAGPVDEAALGHAMAEACAALARQMADDAEGVTRTATVTVTGAASDADAHAGARKVAGSLLVKCSLNGADPYWGRIVSELGSARIAFDLDRTDVAYGDVVVCRGGVGVEHDRALVASHLGGRHVAIHCHLGLGTGTGSVLCCDLGEGYLQENRTTS